MRETLIANGWLKTSASSCCGGLTEIYTNDKFPGYAIRVRPKKDTFQIRQRGSIIVGPEYSDKLLDKMRAYDLI